MFGKFSGFEAKKEYSLLEANLETGRTHQLRVQLAGMGFPILGDGKYGKRKREECTYTHIC